MTIRELMNKLKSISPQALTDKVKAIADGLGDCTVYPASTSGRWKSILSELGDIGSSAVGVTFYGTNATVIDRLRAALKQKYSVVGSIQYDSWRHIFVCGKDNNDTDPLVVCVNWYSESRESVKAQYRDEDANSDADDSYTLNDEEDENIFA